MKKIMLFVSFMALSFFCSAQVTEQQFMDSISIRLRHSEIALHNYKFVYKYYSNLFNNFDSICKKNFKYKLLGKSIFQSKTEIKYRLNILNRCEWILLEQFLNANTNTFLDSLSLIMYTNTDLYQNSPRFKDWLTQERLLASNLRCEFNVVAKQEELLSLRVKAVKSKYKFDSNF